MFQVTNKNVPSLCGEATSTSTPTPKSTFTSTSSSLQLLTYILLIALNYTFVIIVGINTLIATIITNTPFMPTMMNIVMKGMTFLINISPLQIYIHGDALADDHYILVANHSSNNDGIFIQYWTTMFHKSKNSRFLYKKSLQKIPIIGSIMQDLNYIALSRTWKQDKTALKRGIQRYHQYQRIIIFPEGTRFTTKKHQESIKYAQQHKLPQFNHTLLPRTKGFDLIVRNTTAPLYDVTIVYQSNGIHIHAKRWAKRNVGPTWLMDRFQDKQTHWDNPFPPNDSCGITHRRNNPYQFIEHFSFLLLAVWLFLHAIQHPQYIVALTGVTVYRWIV